MFEQNQEVLITVVLGTLVFILLMVVLIILIVQYNNRQRRNYLETEALKNSFQIELAQSQLEVREQTLQTIATDLHDNIGQILSYTKAVVSSIDINQTEKAAAKIFSANILLQKSIDELRQLARLMQGENILADGLINAIEQELNWLNKNNLYQTRFTHDFNPLAEEKEMNLVLFRLVQEVLNNTVKHAQAKNIIVDLQLHNNQLTLLMQDDGIGFDLAEKKSATMGLQNLERRTALLKGSLEILAVPHKGTSVKITVPYSL